MSVGYIEAKYSTLVVLFGLPQGGDSEKVDAEWRNVAPLMGTSEPFSEVEIYNYCTGRAYLGEEGPPVEEITGWHVQTYPNYQLARAVEELQKMVDEFEASDDVSEDTVWGPKFPDVKVELIGRDSNVFGLVGAVTGALKRAGHVEEAKAFANEAFDQPSYDAVLALIQKTVVVV